MEPCAEGSGSTGSRSRLGLLLTFVLLGLTQLAPARSASRFEVDVDNFGQIDSTYYRGAQPDRDGFEALKRLGCKTVIDLQKDPVEDEPAWVRRAGMRYVNIPLSTSRPATASETEYFLRLVNDPANQPVFVHCKGGKHRTGEMTAIYRITHDSWTADQAYQEMKRYKFYSFPFQGPLKDYVYRYYDQYQHSSTLARASQAGASAEPVGAGK